MADQAQVGPQGTALLGSITNLRAGGQCDLIVSELHARGYESTLRGHRFGAAMQAVLATATVAGLTTTLTGAITLYNPVTSPVNLSVEKFGIGFVLAPAAPLVYGLATGQSQTAISGTLTALTPKSKNVSAGELFRSERQPHHWPWQLCLLLDKCSSACICLYRFFRVGGSAAERLIGWHQWTDGRPWLIPEPHMCPPIGDNYGLTAQAERPRLSCPKMASRYRGKSRFPQ